MAGIRNLTHVNGAYRLTVVDLTQRLSAEAGHAAKKISCAIRHPTDEIVELSQQKVPEALCQLLHPIRNNRRV